MDGVSKEFVYVQLERVVGPSRPERVPGDYVEGGAIVERTRLGG